MERGYINAKKSRVKVKKDILILILIYYKIS